MKTNKLRFPAFLILLLFLLTVPARAGQLLIPGGNTVGIRLQADGFLVSGFEENSPARDAGLQKGDRITAVNSQPLTSAEQLQQLLRNGSAVTLTVERGGRTAQYYAAPRKTDEGWRLGVYLRSQIAGIGTVTYYDPETGAFGALGHGVADPSGRSLFPAVGGELVRSEVESVRKGLRGTPGELKGRFDPDTIIGSVEKNTPFGIYGTLSEAPDRQAMMSAEPEQVHAGDAQILANVEAGRVEAYSIRIEKLDPDAENGRDLLLTVTDPRLLELTGGVVQGMSGSPIVQDGLLVGAVTHVLVNNPEKGYGILIGNMLKAAS